MSGDDVNNIIDVEDIIKSSFLNTVIAWELICNYHTLQIRPACTLFSAAYRI